jgi:hypothetical protein
MVSTLRCLVKRLIVQLSDLDMAGLEPMAHSAQFESVDMPGRQLAAYVADKRTRNGARRAGDISVLAKYLCFLTLRKRSTATILAELNGGAGGFSLTRRELIHISRVMKTHHIAFVLSERSRTLGLRALRRRTHWETSLAVSPPSGAEARPSTELNGDAERQRRLAAASKILGLWTGRSDTPKDGVAFQKALRAEWS